jgi:hypothetical protein
MNFWQVRPFLLLCSQVQGRAQDRTQVRDRDRDRDRDRRLVLYRLWEKGLLKAAPVTVTVSDLGSSSLLGEFQNDFDRDEWKW